MDRIDTPETPPLVIGLYPTNGVGFLYAVKLEQHYLSPLGRTMLKRTRNSLLLPRSTIWTCQMKITNDPIPADPDEAWLVELLEREAPTIMERHYRKTPLFHLMPDTLSVSTQIWHRRLTFPQVYFTKESRQRMGIDTPTDIDSVAAEAIIADANRTLSLLEQCHLIPYHVDQEHDFPYVGPATYAYLRTVLREHGIDSDVNGDYQEWTPGKGGKNFITYQPLERWAIKYNGCRNKRKK